MTSYNVGDKVLVWAEVNHISFDDRTVVLEIWPNRFVVNPQNVFFNEDDLFDGANGKKFKLVEVVE